jgi:ABC-type Mn2+/Zn2+ transport system ATPase subunit
MSWSKAMSEVLRVEGLTVGYNGKEVISGLSFSVEDGDVLAVIGPNGSGKTSLLKALLGLMPVKAGRFFIFGKERLKAAERRIAYIPQRMELDRTFPISLGEMLNLHGGGASTSLLNNYVDFLELRGLLSKRVGELSGGEMQRALLAYALIKEPRLLVMDEPTSWVDIKGADCVLCIMEEFKRKGIAMIIVSHDFSVIRSVATSVLGIGHEGHFIERADSPALDEKIESLFGTSHHGVRVCPTFRV